MNPLKDLIENFKNLNKVVAYGEALVTHISNGSPVTPPDIFNQRITLCTNCEFRNKDKLDMVECSVCGCDMNLKASWADMECPKKFWLALPMVGASGGCGCNN